MKKNRSAMLNSSQIDAILAAIDFSTDQMTNRAHILGFMELAQRLASRNANLTANECELLCACLDLFIIALEDALSNPLLSPEALPGSPADLQAARSARQALLPFVPARKSVQSDPDSP